MPRDNQRAGAAGGAIVTPYFDDGQGIVIYHGDCREVLESLRPMVGLVVTDPPFYLPARVSTSRRAWPRTLSEVAIMESYFRDAFATIVSRLRWDGALYTFCDGTSYPVFFSLLYPLFARTQCIVWDKGVGGMGNGWRHSNELIVHGAFAQTTYADGFRRDVLACRPLASESREHPSEKPVPLLTTLLLAHTLNDYVLDPFAGVGSTLVAAHALGLPAIGIEIEERYCEIAAKRLQQQVLPLEIA